MTLIPHEGPKPTGAPDTPPTPQLLYKVIIHFLPYFQPGSCKMSRENNQLKAIIKIFEL